ncbi:MAG: glycosyl hydrolase [Burkholderiales bacterium PBB3]|nr:MAG: glycosyl hydrolase [Burkholderiales bacterium PBB3]
MFLHPRLIRAGLALAASLLAAACTTTPPQSTALLFGPYKHINMGLDAQHKRISGLQNGQSVALTQGASHILPPGVNALSLAFASGECGQENWGGVPATALADANLKGLVQARLPYIISTGGEGGVFTCGTDTGFAAFIQRYTTPALIGFDFDIEANQTETMIRDLVQRVKLAQQARPHLRFSFTVATFAANDGSGASLNATGQIVMRALQDFGVRDYVINLMVMNYGPATATNCVVRQGRCDMAASAEQAVQNLRAKYGLAPSQIAVTAMLGVNDVVENVFTPQDAQQLARFAKAQGLAGLHYWSLDRDTPCVNGATAVSPACSSLNAVPAQAYLQAFLAGLQ